MGIVEKAVIFAVEAHGGAVRKRSNVPYILHPLEAASIAGSLSTDHEVIAAALLHDTVEDAGISPDAIRAEFGERVAFLVASETENKRPDVPPAESWQIRKEESLKVLEEAEDDGVRVLWLSDKLSNMRAFYREYVRNGSKFWESFNMKDPSRQAWYYRTVAKLTSSLSDSCAWKEFNELTEKVFEDVKNDEF